MIGVPGAAALGTILGLTPAQIDKVWNVMRYDGVAVVPSQFIKQFTWHAQDLGYLPRD